MKNLLIGILLLGSIAYAGNNSTSRSSSSSRSSYSAPRVSAPTRSYSASPSRSTTVYRSPTRQTSGGGYGGRVNATPNGNMVQRPVVKSQTRIPPSRLPGPVTLQKKQAASSTTIYPTRPRAVNANPTIKVFPRTVYYSQSPAPGYTYYHHNHYYPYPVSYYSANNYDNFSNAQSIPQSVNASPSILLRVVMWSFIIFVIILILVYARRRMDENKKR